MTVTTHNIASVRIGGVEYKTAGACSVNIGGGPINAPDKQSIIGAKALYRDAYVASAFGSGKCVVKFESLGAAKLFMRRLRRFERVAARPRRRSRCQTRVRAKGRSTRRKVVKLRTQIQRTLKQIRADLRKHLLEAFPSILAAPTEGEKVPFALDPMFDRINDAWAASQAEANDGR